MFDKKNPPEESNTNDNTQQSIETEIEINIEPTEPRTRKDVNPEKK